MAHLPFHTSITERGSFRSCRRRWYLEAVENLAHKDRIPWPLIFGNAVHEGLAAYYTDNKRDTADALDAFHASWDDERALLEKSYGGLYDAGVGDEWLSMKEKGEKMLTYYDIYDRQNKFWDEVLEVNIEERSFVSILDHKGAPYERAFLSGKIDLVVHRKGSGIWIVDHKTAANTYDARALDIDDQLTGYAYIWWRISGDPPRGVIYNALIKEPPRPPKVLQSGALSQDKGQRTTYDLYLQQIKDLELDPKNYSEMLEFLEKKGWHQFFVRDGLTKNVEELESFEWRLQHEYLDMQKALKDEGYRYPNPSQMTCPGCSMVPVCQAMEEQSDVQFIRDTMYEVREPRVVLPEGV